MYLISFLDCRFDDLHTALWLIWNYYEPGKCFPYGIIFCNMMVKRSAGLSEPCSAPRLPRIPYVRCIWPWASVLRSFTGIVCPVGSEELGGRVPHFVRLPKTLRSWGGAADGNLKEEALLCSHAPCGSSPKTGVSREGEHPPGHPWKPKGCRRTSELRVLSLLYIHYTNVYALCIYGGFLYLICGLDTGMLSDSHGDVLRG